MRGGGEGPRQEDLAFSSLNVISSRHLNDGTAFVDDLIGDLDARYSTLTVRHYDSYGNTKE